MSNKLNKIVDAIECGKRFQSGALLVTPSGNAYSYDVCIYDFDSNTLHVKKYSSTTSGHQNILRSALERLGFATSPKPVYSETEVSLNKRIA